jgi:hypothetical protein
MPVAAGRFVTRLGGHDDQNATPAPAVRQFPVAGALLTRRPYKAPRPRKARPKAKPATTRRSRKPDPATDAKVDQLARAYWTEHDRLIPPRHADDGIAAMIEPIADLRARFLTWAAPIQATLDAAIKAVADPLAPGAADAINAVVELFNGDRDGNLDSDGVLATLGYIADAIAEHGTPSERTIARERQRIADDERQRKGDPNRPALLAKVDAVRGRADLTTAELCAEMVLTGRRAFEAVQTAELVVTRPDDPRTDGWLADLERAAAELPDLVAEVKRSRALVVGAAVRQ